MMRALEIFAVIQLTIVGLSHVFHHRAWSGIPLVLTIVGVLYLVKTVQCFMLPEVSLRSLNRVSLERSRVFIGVGLFFLLIALVTTVSLA